MKILADECVDVAIIEILKKNKYEILVVVNLCSGENDDVVLDLSNKESALMLTEDKDFGELVFRLKKII